MSFKITKKGWTKKKVTCSNCFRNYDVYLDEDGNIVKAKYLIHTKKKDVFRCAGCNSELTWDKNDDSHNYHTYRI